MIDLALLDARRDDCDVYFPAGLPGFEDAHRFRVRRWTRPQPFSVLECLDRADCSFVVVAATLLDDGCEVDVDAALRAHPELEDPATGAVRCIVVPGRAPTVNRLGPIVVDRSTGVAYQVPLDLPRHATRSPLALRG